MTTLSPTPVAVDSGRRGFLLGSLAVTATLLVGCGSEDENRAAAPATGASEPRTVEHPLGSTTIPSRPERIVALGDYSDLDNLLSVGALPVSYGFSNSWEKGVSPWQRSAGAPDLETFTGGEPNLELLAGLQPDLIVGMDWNIGELYDRLSSLAPTVALSESLPWRDALALTGRATWTDDAATDALAATEDLIAAQAERLAPLAGRTVMVGSAFGDQLYLQGKGSPFSQLAADLGLTFRDGGDEPLVQLSLERTDKLQPAEVLLSFATDVGGTRAIERSPLFTGLPAVEAGAYEALPTDIVVSVAGGLTPVSAAWGLPRLADALLRCAAGEGRPLS